MEAVFITTKQDLQEAISEAFDKQIKSSLPDLVKEATAKEWLTKEELIEFTGWSSRTIQNLRDTDQIPYAQHGRKILYPRKGILDFLEQHHIKPQER